MSINKPTHNLPQVAVFAASAFAQPVIAYLLQHKLLAGVILPALDAHRNVTAEVKQLAEQCESANIRWQLAYKDESDLISKALTSWNADTGLIATYPHLLPHALVEHFNLPKHRGLYNLHASALPAYRGPQPLYWQLRDIESKTAIVLHRATAFADAGHIVIRRDVSIHPLDTLPSLGQRMAYEAAAACEEFMAQLLATTGPLTGIEQVQAQNIPAVRAYAHRPSLKERTVSFGTMTASEISALCRAGNASAYTALITIKGLTVNLLQATPITHATFGTQPGTVLHVGEPEGLLVCAKNSVLRLDIIASPDGIYTGQTFAERFDIDAGTPLEPCNTLSNTFFQQPA